LIRYAFIDGFLFQFSKEARHARWRTYSKACLDSCNKLSMWALNERVNPNNKVMADLSPKNVKQLEILKPLSTPSMGRRHMDSLEKEKRLEMASRPIQSKASTSNKDTDTKDDDYVAEHGKTKDRRKKNKRRNKNMAKNESDMLDKKVGMDQKDLVEDLNWSDEG
jgi:hypothetical protein